MTTHETGPDTVHAAGHDYVKGDLSSLGQLVGEITDDLSQLVRQELNLAKAEARQSATRAGKGVGLLAGAGLAATYILLFLSLALWWLVGDWLDSLGWSAVVVAGVWAVITAVLALVGRSQLKNVRGLPQTVATTKQVPDALTGSETNS